MSAAFNYETFIRSAFGYRKEDHTFHLLDRWGDPASLANTDYFNDHNLNRVKSATSYAMYIFIHEIIENSQLSHQEDYDEESDRIDAIVDNVLYSKDIMEVLEYVDEFRNTVIEKYMIISEGVIKIKDHSS